MPFDETLAQRVRASVAAVCPVDRITEKRMFGGLCVMLDGNMLCGIVADKLMVRVSKEDHDLLMELPHTAEMDFTGRAMQGFLYVHPEGIATTGELNQWVARCADYTRTLPPKKKPAVRKAAR